MILTIKATNMELTDPIREYAETKATSLEKFFKQIQKIEIDIGLDNKHHLKGKIFYAEMNIHVPGKIIRVVKEAETLYKAIDKVKDHLKAEMSEENQKRQRRDKKVLRDKKEYSI